MGEREVSRARAEMLEAIDKTISPYWQGGRQDTIEWLVGRVREVESELAIAREALRSLRSKLGGVEVDILFDGPPGPEAGRFVDVEDLDGRGRRVGRWIERDDGLWALRLTVMEVDDD